ncbi:hypothetical protein BN2497_5487 [Janthinobacterium sp. CG23_2]|nr:hypothetical protein BN2497_5487 [Janthinobacterium sp. CG23_2]CUU29141.1 hypothetical protein BN3177_5487 [Janthinobacterium sp. CG23_2]
MGRLAAYSAAASENRASNVDLTDGEARQQAMAARALQT